MYSVLVTPPAEEPITLADAKQQARVTHALEDPLIAAFVSAARQYAEEYTKRSFITQTRRAVLDFFPARGAIILPRPPVLAITELAYTAWDGTRTVITDALLDPHPVAPAIRPAYGTDWPLAREIAGAVTVTYTAGYGGAADVPEAIKQAIRLTVGTFYANREDVNVGNIVSEMPVSAKRLLDPYRVRVVS